MVAMQKYLIIFQIMILQFLHIFFCDFFGLKCTVVDLMTWLNLSRFCQIKKRLSIENTTNNYLHKSSVICQSIMVFLTGASPCGLKNPFFCFHKLRSTICACDALIVDVIQMFKSKEAESSSILRKSSDNNAPMMNNFSKLNS